jgi:hypothetical protein
MNNSQPIIVAKSVLVGHLQMSSFFCFSYQSNWFLPRGRLPLKRLLLSASSYNFFSYRHIQNFRRNAIRPSQRPSRHLHGGPTT